VSGQTKVFSEDVGQISGTLLLDDSWERKVYVSYIKTFEKVHAVSNDLIIESAVIDSLGNFKLDLDNLPKHWSLLRLHIVKKGVSPNSLTIGSVDENFMFIIANRNSEIHVTNTEGLRLFEHIKVEGTDYMHTYSLIKKLSNYPNSLDYENSLIEKEFMREVVSEKLKTVADTCSNPLVSLYAMYQTDFQTDYLKNPTYYEKYLSKWKNQNSSYFKSFRQNFPEAEVDYSTILGSEYVTLVLSVLTLTLLGVFLFSRMRKQRLKKLSVQERKIFDLLRSGLSNKEISAECNIELTTVKSHVGKIYSKLKIKSRKEAMNLNVKDN
jgi:DNA-binding CsgD family transcriptional regulator